MTTRCQPFAGRVKGHRINEVGMLEVVAGRISCQLPLLHGLVQAGREERTGAGEDNARNRIQLRERLDQLANSGGNGWAGTKAIFQAWIDLSSQAAPMIGKVGWKARLRMTAGAVMLPINLASAKL